MSEGWISGRLEDVCHVYQPETLSQKSLQDGPCPVYGANGQIGWHAEFNHENAELLLGCRGSCGFVHFTQPRAWINGNSMVVRPLDGKVGINFLAYALRGGIDISSAITGAAQPQITRASLMPVAIRYPRDVAEQHRIVAILDEAFAGIATAKANAEKNLRNAREVMNSYLQSVFSLERDVEKLGGVFETVTGGTPPKSEARYYGEFMPFVKPPELCDGELDSAADSLTELGAAVARTLPPNSILVSCIGNLGKVGLNVVPVAFNQQINAILPDASKAVPKFMFFQALSRSFKEQLEKLASGTTVPIVNKSKFNSIRVTVPSIRQQELIVNRLAALRKETARLESLYAHKLAALDELKQSLLHQAFSGQL